MNEETKPNRTPVIVAIIGLIGVITTAWIANYDKCAGAPPNNSNKVTAALQNSAAASQDPAAAQNSVPQNPVAQNPAAQNPAAQNPAANSVPNSQAGITQTPTPAPNDKGHFYYSIQYLTCNQHYQLPLKEAEIAPLKWQAKWDGDRFWHTPEKPKDGSSAQGEPHYDDALRYLTWDGSCWEARWNGKDKFSHKKLSASDQHLDERINYVNWNRTKWSGRREGEGFFLLFVAVANE